MVDETQFVNASDFIQSDPQPAFKEVLKAGFQLWYQIEHPEGERHVYIKASLSGNYVGKADFAESDTTTDIQNIIVEKAFRRRGVGKAMCVLAAKILQKPLRNIWEVSEMSEDGRAFWEHLGRQLDSQSE